MRRMVWAFLAVAVPASAQPAAVELFGHVGLFRGGSDDGSLGRAPSFGGIVTVPLARRIALDFDAQTARLSRHGPTPDRFWTSRRTLLSPSLLYRWGSETTYGFAGGGVGAERVANISREDNFAEWYTPGPPWREIRPRVFEARYADWRRTVPRPDRFCGLSQAAPPGARGVLLLQLAPRPAHRPGLSLRGLP